MSNRFAEFYSANSCSGFFDFKEWDKLPPQLIALSNLQDCIRMDFDRRGGLGGASFVHTAWPGDLQQTVDYIIDDDHGGVLEALSGLEHPRGLSGLEDSIRSKVRGYIVSVDPYRDRYRHFAYISEWSDCGRHIWENDWLENGSRGPSKDIL